MSTNTFNRDNLDFILKELAKEYRRLGGKLMPAEIILIGGAAIIERYGFRDMTTDIDAIIRASSIMKDAINIVGDKLRLPVGWLNDDFKRTSSYSLRLGEVSQFYKTFYGVLDVRTISAEYLIAMKLKAGRRYKNDLSDIVGILNEHKARGNDITFEQIKNAIIKLYGGFDSIDETLSDFVQKVCANGNYSEIYEEVRENEKLAKDVLVEFNKDYPNVANTDNVDDILKVLKNRKKNI